MPTDKLTCMRLAGKVNRDAINYGFQKAVPGKTLIEIDHEIENFIVQSNCKPAFKGYRNFPATTCISVNDTVIHGIPTDYILMPGDILTIDLGTELNGWNVDAADTRIVQDASTDVSTGEFCSRVSLIEAAHYILAEEISILKHNCSLLDIIKVAELAAKKHHVTIFPYLGGHQIGEQVHMDPFIPNTINRNTTQLKQSIDKYKYQNYKLTEGMTICLEPVVTFGSTEVLIDQDGWTVKTKDKSLSAHVEKCVLINRNDCEILS